MKGFKVISQKCGRSYLVWHQNLNRFLMLRQPAFETLNLIQSGKPVKEIKLYLHEKFGYDERFAAGLIHDLKKSLSFKKEDIQEATDKKSVKNLMLPDTFQSTHFYAYLNKTLKFEFDNPNLKNLVHPYIKHLETENSHAHDFNYKLFKSGEHAVLQMNTQQTKLFSASESNLLTGEIMYGLTNDFYQSQAGEWIMTIHASAVADAEKAILFTGTSGSGKTTIASLLSHQGYSIINDDMILVDNQFRAYSFPLAYSVKTGSLSALSDIFPQLQHSNELNDGVKNFRLQTPQITENGKKVKAVVFVKYNPDIEFRFKRVGKANSIAMLLKEIYLEPTPECIRVFMKNISKTRFYSLEYSNQEPALKALTGLFENE